MALSLASLTELHSMRTPSELEPEAAEEAPWSEDITDYDTTHFTTYIRLLDAEAAGADWRDAAEVILHCRPTIDPAGVELCWRSHMARARWMTETGYRKLLQD